MSQDHEPHVNLLHEMSDASDRATDKAWADYLDTPEGAAERQAEVDAAEAEALHAMVAFFEHLPAGPEPSDQQRERWAAASQANQELRPVDPT